MGSEQSLDRLYNSTRWRKLRSKFLNEHPLCNYCEQRNIIKPATIVDHIVPHKGDLELFWSESNLQSLCKTCHDSAKAIKEQRGMIPGCDNDGMPLDKEHPWNKTE